MDKRAFTTKSTICDLIGSEPPDWLRGKSLLPLVNCDDGESKSLWLHDGWHDQTVAQEVLFDLSFDPNEMRNLVDNEASQAVLQEMRDRLNRWMEETKDSLFTGNVPAPAGARVNNANGRSAREKPKSLCGLA